MYLFAGVVAALAVHLEPRSTKPAQWLVNSHSVTPTQRTAALRAALLWSWGGMHVMPWVVIARHIPVTGKCVPFHLCVI
jgi:hypothetical protein